ncbi:MAG: TIR domain-containing protein [Candidatus Delongbacteria bacterium]|nr:TIR domain-containing protein [Candidatus Delongbacteria bacterium]
MKELSIYIDYSWSNDEIAEKLKRRLQNIKGIRKVVTYGDIVEDEDAWELETLKAIDSADIVIPILSEGYLSFVSKKIESRFDSIIDSKDKFLFPIIYKSSEWGSFNWIVRSKLIPADGEPLSNHSKDDVEEIINGLIKTIKNIAIRLSVEQKVENKIEMENLSDNKNIIFISHNHNDADFAELLKLKLEKNGLTGWIDNERLKIGQDWREEIDIGIKNSIAVIAIMTPDARKSEYVTYEWAFAWGKGKKIFPIMLKQTQLHPRLESLQYLDFTNRASRPWDKLIESIKEIKK